MGASREVQFAVLAEPAFFLAVLALARASGTWELAGVLGGTPLPGVTTILVAATLTAVLLCENSRIPVDDPNTHLELTMIHEVMVLDHSGPDLAMILYASSLKLWLYAAIMVGALLPVSTLPPAMVLPVWLAALFAVAVVVGLVESAMARLRLLHMPRLLAGAAILSLVAVFWG
jgi:formate hydrogenlyase subunit 4